MKTKHFIFVLIVLFLLLLANLGCKKDTVTPVTPTDTSFCVVHNSTKVIIVIAAMNGLLEVHTRYKNSDGLMNDIYNLGMCCTLNVRSGSYLEVQKCTLNEVNNAHVYLPWEVIDPPLIQCDTTFITILETGFHINY